MNLVYNWLVNYTHSDSKIIIPLKESSNDKGACICIIEAVALIFHIINSFPPKPSPSQQRKEKDSKLLKWIVYFE